MLQSNSLGQSRKKLYILLAVVGAIVLAVAGYFIWDYIKLKNSPNALAQETTQRIIGKVDKLYAVPAGEEPTVAEVKDKEKLKDQTFFKSAENGDFILIYTNSKIAILYRESANKLVNVGPIAISDEAVKNSQKPTTSKVTVSVINGTNTAGRAATLGGQLTSKLADLVTVNIQYGDAKQKNVTKTLVIDVNKNKSDAAQKIATELGGQVVDLPAGEVKPDADILVIAGP